ncbi:hypothetical protein MTO96_040384 [Rhipicephalus appendiculatus]
MSSSLEQITPPLVALVTAAAWRPRTHAWPTRGAADAAAGHSPFSGQDATRSFVDFIDDLSPFKTVCGFSDLDVLQWVQPVALRGAAAQWLRFQLPFLT